jgi:hypothetical protein
MSDLAIKPPGGGATISTDGHYRYDLTRRWGEGDTGLTWVMLNPSTADAETDDPTIRRCMGFSKAWGFGGTTVLNLYGYRTSDPKKLLRVDSPGGLENHDIIRRRIGESKLVVAAWGAFADKVAAVWGRTSIETLCHRFDVPLRCLGRTQSGAPRHPLYVKAHTVLEPFGIFEANL